MLCDEVIIRLWEYLDQELAPEDAAQVAVHLSDCSVCYPVYCQDRAFLALVARVKRSVTAPPALTRWARRLA
jgi:anti-sigma factor (TIGR02949 family)